jgi:ribonuclease HIII
MSGEMLKMSIDRISRVVSPEKYNKLFEELSKEGKNSNDILAWAHSEVVKDLIEKAGTNDVQIIIDKFDFNKTDSRLSSKERVRSVDQTKIKVIQKSKGESEIPVAAASIIAKSIFEEEVQKLSNKYGVDLKSIPPNDLPRDIIPKVAKTNFKNIKAVLS